MKIALIASLFALTACTSQQLEQFAAKQQQAAVYCDKAKAAFELVKTNKAEVCGPLMVIADLSAQPQLAKAKEACSNEAPLKNAEEAMISACAVVNLLQLP